MRLFFTLSLLTMSLVAKLNATVHVINNSGFNFVPANLTVSVGDTVDFVIGGTHNAVEVSKETFDSGGTASNGGFSVPFGGGRIIITEAKTYYYVCQPHVGLDMIGTIVAEGTVEPENSEVFHAKLSGINEALSILSGASGSVSASLDGSTLVVEGSFAGLTGDFDANVAGGSHIHKGYAGQNGGIELTLIPNLADDLRSGSFTAANNTFELTEAQIDLLKSRQLYINIHSTTFGSGELRGQLLPEADQYFGTTLYGSNEVPSVVSKGAGALMMELEGDSLFVSGSFNNLEGALATDVAGGAHLHMGAAGQNGGIIFPLDLELSEDGFSGIVSGAFLVDEAQKTMMQNRMVYANFHSAFVRSGELRGQIRSLADAVFRAKLSGSNEVSPVVSAGNGHVLFELIADTLVVSGSFSGMSSDLNTNIGGGAHIHLGYAGQNGGVVLPLVASQSGVLTEGTFLPDDNTFVLTEEQKAQLMKRQFYVNIHSLSVPSGELRGQVVPESQFYFNGFLTGMQEADPVLTKAYGAIIAEVQGSQLSLSGSFANLSSDLNIDIAGGVHIHNAKAGSNGPIAFLISTTPGSDATEGSFEVVNNAVQLSEGLLDTLKTRGLYMNIHSLNVASGELRAQLLPEATIYFQAILSGSSETTPAKTNASGTVLMEWNPGQVISSGSFNGLASDFNTGIAGGAHFHYGFAGQNGGILYLLNSVVGNDGRSATFEPMDNILSVTESFPDTILGRQIYVNIHSTEIPSGEIRGQVLPFANNYFTATLNSLNEVQPAVSSGSGALKMELSGARLTTSGSFEGLTGDFDASIGRTGAHIHTGQAGENGGIAVDLNVETATDLKAGIITSTSNAVDLTDDQIDLLFSSNLYANFHTTAVPSGELRGQALPEANAFPLGSQILTPENGGAVALDLPGDTPFEATWETATDPDMNPVAYIWQLSADTTFTNPVLSVNRKDTTSFESTIGVVNQLLIDLGIMEGASVTVYHRVVTSDGSLNTAGDFASVTLTNVTEVNDFVLGQAKFQVFPNPARDLIELNIETVESVDGMVQILNLQGKLLWQNRVRLIEGQNNEQLNISNLASGTYFLQLWFENRLAAVKRVVVKK